MVATVFKQMVGIRYVMTMEACIHNVQDVSNTAVIMKRLAHRNGIG